MVLLNLRRRTSLAGVMLLALWILAGSPAAVLGQAGDGGHASHHPAAPGSAPAQIAPSGAGGAPAAGGAGMGCAGGMMGCMQGAPQKQLYPALMSMPALTPAERQSAEHEAYARMSSGLPLLVGGADDAMRAFSTGDPAAMRDAGERVRQGLSLFDSGLSTHVALAGGEPPQAVALAWFKDQMNLPQAGAAAQGSEIRLLGFSPGHIATMIGLALSAASLLAIQVMRARRVQSILQRTGQPTRSVAPGLLPPLPATDSLPARPPIFTAPSAAAAEPAASTDTVVPPRQTPARRAWSGVLKVAQVVRETPLIKTFRLVEPSGAPLPFDYLPGQFMNVEVEPTPGEVLRRAYTIASSPTRQAYAELSIKREAQGKVSQFLHDRVKVGDLLKVGAPYGAFTFTGLDEDSIVLVGGGVGITPLMSVLRYLTDRAWPGEIYFVYSARSTQEFVFRDELAYLQRRHPNLHVLATMTRSEGTDWMGPEGQITKELLQSAVPDLARRRIHVCGPPPMMAALKELLAALGVPADRIHTEAFGPASLPAGKLQAAPPTPAEAARFGGATPAVVKPMEAVVAPAPNTVIFSRSGKSAALPADATVLEAAESAGVEIPWSCRVGICGICKVKLQQGSVSMEVEEGLPAEDKAAGLILACQAKSTGGNLQVEA
ncbi:2Fe-2S iron-sulfur cluster-binding protein [Methylorubrum thiocyanatum]|uniref:2Fe-2S iron-sulfur cluster-binding protein n=1 Tax=Methylorubrum thiocyanatum TaxID=47958 RepID=UPI0035C87EBD